MSEPSGPESGMWPIRLMATGALLAWLVLLWLMFGDVM